MNGGMLMIRSLNGLSHITSDLCLGEYARSAGSLLAL